MNIQAAVDRAVKDPAFAAQLKSQALAAAHQPKAIQPFADLLAHFADSPAELAKLVQEKKTHGTNWISWTLTLTTLTTAGCATTTTTTTASHLCPR